MSKELRIVGPLHNWSGFARSGRGLLSTALAAGYTVEAVESESDVVIRGYQDGRVERVRRPHNVDPFMPDYQRAELDAALATKVADDAPTILYMGPTGLGMCAEWSEGPRIGITMTESDKLGPLHAQAARNVDMLAVPCEWNRKTFDKGVPCVPVDLMPMPVDPRQWSPEGPKLRIKRKPEFLFYSSFSTCERKNWRMLIQAFGEEFAGEDVGLFCHCTRATEVEELAAWMRERGAWILVDGKLKSNEWLARMYRTADCFALASAEGFGLPFVEAAMCGTPSVALGGGGTADTVTEETGYVVPAIDTPCIGQVPQYYRSDQHMVYCTIQDLRATLRRAYEDRASKGEAARERALARYTPEALAPTLKQLVQQGMNRHVAMRSYVASWRAPETVPPLTAIIGTHNHLDSTQRLAASLERNTPDLRIILADDHSEDGTLEWAAAKGIDVVTTGIPGNLSANRNAALKLVDPRSFVVHMDNDVVVTEGWWEKLAAVFDENPMIGLLSPRKVYGGEMEGMTQDIGCRFRADGYSYPCAIERPLVWPDYLETACLLARPACWSEIAFDELLPYWWGDTDYCQAARAAGWEIAATNLVTVVHYAHTTSPERQHEGDYGRKRFLTKWRGRFL